MQREKAFRVFRGHSSVTLQHFRGNRILRVFRVLSGNPLSRKRAGNSLSRKRNAEFLHCTAENFYTLHHTSIAATTSAIEETFVRVMLSCVEKYSSEVGACLAKLMRVKGLPAQRQAP